MNGCLYEKYGFFQKIPQIPPKPLLGCLAKDVLRRRTGTGTGTNVFCGKGKKRRGREDEEHRSCCQSYLYCRADRIFFCKKEEQQRCTRQRKILRIQWERENAVLITTSWVEIKVGDPAISPLETRGFPTPFRNGCGFINFLVPARKWATLELFKTVNQFNEELRLPLCYDLNR